MAFITDTDYKVLVSDQDLDIIQQGDSSIRLNAEAMAEEEIKGYLRSRFDVEHEFALTGSDRNQVLLMYLMDLTLWHLHTAIPGRFVPETRETRYNNAISWLGKVAKGIVTPNLKYKDEEDTGNPMQWGSMDVMGVGY